MFRFLMKINSTRISKYRANMFDDYEHVYENDTAKISIFCRIAGNGMCSGHLYSCTHQSTAWLRNVATNRPRYALFEKYQ